MIIFMLTVAPTPSPLLLLSSFMVDIHMIKTKDIAQPTVGSTEEAVSACASGDSGQLPPISHDLYTALPGGRAPEASYRCELPAIVSVCTLCCLALAAEAQYRVAAATNDFSALYTVLRKEPALKDTITTLSKP